MNPFKAMLLTREWLAVNQVFAHCVIAAELWGSDEDCDPLQLHMKKMFRKDRIMEQLS